MADYKRGLCPLGPNGRHEAGSRAQMDCPEHGVVAFRASAASLAAGKAAIPVPLKGGAAQVAQLGPEDIAQHPLSTPQELDEVSRTTSWVVKDMVARHPNVAPETLSRLSEDKSSDVRWRVTQHPLVRVSDLIFMASLDPSKEVRDAAIARLNNP